MRRSLLLLALALAACAPKADPAAEVKAIRAADDAFLAAIATKNVDSIVTFWTADAHLLSPKMTPNVGTSAIHQMVTASFALPGFSITWHTDTIIVGPSGDMAYSLGSNTFTFPSAVAGKIDTVHNQVVGVWMKGADGRWRMAVDASTPAP